MSLICRLTGQNILNKCFAHHHHQNNIRVLTRKIQMNIIPKNDTPVKLSEHDKHNEDLGRPMSPHLTIYSVQLTSLLSITHRTTGAMLSGYFYLFAIGSPLWTNYVSFLDSVPLSPTMHVVLKALISLPFSYHLANGVRHLMWDSGRYLNLDEVYKTGYLMTGLTAALTIGFMSL